MNSKDKSTSSTTPPGKSQGGKTPAAPQTKSEQSTKQAQSGEPLPPEKNKERSPKQENL